MTGSTELHWFIICSSFFFSLMELSENEGAGGGTGLPELDETIIHFPVFSSFLLGFPSLAKIFRICTRIEFFASPFSLSFFLLPSSDPLDESESSEPLDDEEVPRFRFLRPLRFFLSLRPSRLLFFFFVFLSSLRLSLSTDGFPF